MSHPNPNFSQPTTYPRKRRRIWPFVFGLIAAVFLLCGGIAVLAQVETPSGAATEFAPTLPAETTAAAPSTTTKAPTKPAKTTPAKPRPVTVEDGTWTVGEDIPAGTYKVNQPIDSDDWPCYWAITKTGSNGQNIIANDLPTGGRPSVVLKRGQTFETARCGTWTKTK